MKLAAEEGRPQEAARRLDEGARLGLPMELIAKFFAATDALDRPCGAGNAHWGDAESWPTLGLPAPHNCGLNCRYHLRSVKASLSDLKGMARRRASTGVNGN